MSRKFYFAPGEKGKGYVVLLDKVIDQFGEMSSGPFGVLGQGSADRFAMGERLVFPYMDHLTRNSIIFLS